MRMLIVIFLLASCGGDPDPARDAGPTADASTADAGNGIDCAESFCGLDQDCCVEQVMPPRVSYFCVAEDLPQACQGTRFSCDGPEDCGDGEICCGANGSVCAAAGKCEGSVVCHTLADCPAFTTACAETPLMLIKICR